MGMVSLSYSGRMAVFLSKVVLIKFGMGLVVGSIFLFKDRRCM
jgi:hypothetical protein